MSSRIFVIGTLPSCDVILSDPYVTNRHARVTLTDTGLVWVEDLGSTNGTYVNGIRVYTRKQMRPGDTLRIGRTVLPWVETLPVEPGVGPASDGGPVR